MENGKGGKGWGGRGKEGERERERGIKAQSIAILHYIILKAKSHVIHGTPE